MSGEESGAIYGLVICNKWPPESVALDKYDASAIIINNNADVTCKFLYENTSSELIEAEFVFPLESTAAVYHLEAVIGKKRLVARCRERFEAEATYNEAVEKGHTAFMMQEDFHMSDTFKMKLGNIGAGDKIELTFKYVIPLYLREVDTSLERFKSLKEPVVCMFSMPGKIGARYGANVPASKLAAKMNFVAEVYGDGGILSVTSAHHTFQVDYLDEAKSHAKVSLLAGVDVVNDFEMEIALEKPHLLASPCEIGSLAKGGFLGMHCIAASFLPNIAQSRASDGDKCEIIFVLDRSGSMSGSRIRKSKEALLLFLKSLPKKCRFQIVSFGSSFSSLFPQPVDYTEENVKEALDHQAQLEANMGGTELYSALKSVYDTPITGEGWYRQIIVLTDGEIFNQDEVIGLVRKNQVNARLFAIGLGNEVSTSLIWGIARAGRGTATFIRDNDNLRTGALSVLKATLQPMLKDVSLKWDVKVDGKAVEPLTVPSQLPPLFSGHYLTVFGLTAASARGDSGNPKVEGTLTLSYKLNEEVQTQITRVESLGVEHENLGLHRLAAKAQLLELVDKYSSLEVRGEESKKEAEEVRQQIVDISVNANVISRFTTFVGVDPDKIDDFVKPQRHAIAETMSMSAQNSATIGSASIFGNAAPCKLQADTGYQEPPAQSKDEVVLVAELQEFGGSWNMNEETAKMLKVDLAQLTSSKLPEAKNEKVWATVLVIAYVRTCLASKKDEWELMVEKAIDWLENDQGCCDVEALIQKAEDVLKKLIKK
nr:hypothetical transcript [Hymenolepis microstoma]